MYTCIGLHIFLKIPPLFSYFLVFASAKIRCILLSSTSNRFVNSNLVGTTTWRSIMCMSLKKRVPCRGLFINNTLISFDTATGDTQILKLTISVETDFYTNQDITTSSSPAFITTICLHFLTLATKVFSY